MTLSLGTDHQVADRTQAIGDPAVPAPCADRLGSSGTIWADMVSTLRERLGLDGAIEDDAIALSLMEIDRFSDPQSRWQAANDSTLGLWLSLKGCDVQRALAPIITKGECVG